MPSLRLPHVTQAHALPAALSVLALLSPAGLLAIAALTRRGPMPAALWAGAGVTALLALVLQRFVAGRPLHTPLTGLPAAIAAVAWWLGDRHGDFFSFFVQGGLTLLAVSLFSGYALLATRAPALRRARMVALKMAGRTQWPEDLDACRHVPEVKTLRDALRDEAGPAMHLLTGPPPAVPT